MASLELTFATLTVGDIAAFTNIERAQFMRQHRRPSSDFGFPVNSRDKLSKNEQSQLAERLK